MRFLIALVGAAALSACTLTLPVRGQVQNSTETFSGTATGGVNGAGNLKIVSSNGTQCNGDYVFTEARKGEGVFTCSDGRSGPFTFVSTGRRGSGQGDLGGQKFTFTFGK